jgi:hypothetical protein
MHLITFIELICILCEIYIFKNILSMQKEKCNCIKSVYINQLLVIIPLILIININTLLTLNSSFINLLTVPIYILYIYYIILLLIISYKLYKNNCNCTTKIFKNTIIYYTSFITSLIFITIVIGIIMSINKKKK